MKRFLISLAVLLLLIAVPAVAAEEPVSKLTIDSIPGGADLKISDQFVGYTPATIDVPGGSTVSVVVQRHGGGYDVRRGSVYVPKGEHITYTARHYRTEDKIRTTGYLIVSSTTEGAEVYPDNGYIGMITNDSLIKDKLRLGLHQIVVQKPGYTTYSELVEIKPKNIETTKVSADLTPFATAAPPVTATATAAPPAPTKSPAAGVVISILALLGAAAAFRS